MASVSSSKKVDEDPPQGLDKLPPSLIATIMSKLDVISIQSMASTCKAFGSCAAQIQCFVPSFHLLDISPTMDIVNRFLSTDNAHLRSVRVDCSRLDESFLNILLRPSLKELYLRNSHHFSGTMLSQIGHNCRELKFLYLNSVSEKWGMMLDVAHLEALFNGCSQLETLILKFCVSIFPRHTFSRVWALAPSKLTSLEIGYITALTVTELLSPAVGPLQYTTNLQSSILPNLQKLWLSVDYITDTMVGTISDHLLALTHLDLRDSPVIEPHRSFDLTNSGLEQINAHGRLKHLSLIRTQEIAPIYFRRVNDLGILLMADKCLSMESICLGGFCQVTETGYKTLMHSSSMLYKFRVYWGTHLTDLVFHDIVATSLSLTHVSLRWCNLLTSFGIARLASNQNLCTLDLRDCRNLGDKALRDISTLPSLKTLLLDGCDISDVGLSYLSKGLMNTLVCLSVRGCKKLTDRSISSLFGDSSNPTLRELDLSNLPRLTDAGIQSLAKSQVPIRELRLRQCPYVGDPSVRALASMKFNGNGLLSSPLKLLDIYNCGCVTSFSFKWLRKPYFPRMRWLGIAKSVDSFGESVDDIAESRPYLHVYTRGEELGDYRWDDLGATSVQNFEEVNG